MNNSIYPKRNWLSSGWRMVPFVVIGAIAFSLTSATELNVYLRAYLVLLEVKVIIVLLYFLNTKFAKNRDIDIN
ncbi:hypothetical protein [Floridanema aerugineum]|uniref:Uncharacterized protein n=1 Tax=Floridaenema aerugineum BLCC-F46 TaxID=3153654 RepID=A0ABV4X3A1_9CYAN